MEITTLTFLLRHSWRKNVEVGMGDEASITTLSIHKIELLHEHAHERLAGKCEIGTTIKVDELKLDDEEASHRNKHSHSL